MLVINYVTKLACLTLKVEYFHHFKVPANTSQRSGSVTVCPLKACKGKGQSGWWIKKGGLQLHNRSARPSQQLRVAQSVCDWTPKPPLSFSSVCPTILISQPPLQCWVRDEGVGVRGYWADMAFVPFIKSVASLLNPDQQGYNLVTFSRGWCLPTTTTCKETNHSPILPSVRHD